MIHYHPPQESPPFVASSKRRMIVWSLVGCTFLVSNPLCCHGAGLKFVLMVGDMGMEGFAKAADMEEHFHDSEESERLYGHLFTEDVEHSKTFFNTTDAMHWAIRDDVFIEFNNRMGNATVGYAKRGFGPELEMAHVLGNAIPHDKVVIVKVTRQNSKLFHELKPPGDPDDDDAITTRPQDRSYNVSTTTTSHADDERLEGANEYQKIMTSLKLALSHLNKLDYYDEHGYQILAICFGLGQSDLRSKSDYEHGYSPLLQSLIRNVRIDLKHPNLPVIVTEVVQYKVETQVKKEIQMQQKLKKLGQIQKAVTRLPEFKDNTYFVNTSRYSTEISSRMSPGTPPAGRFDVMFHVGRALGNAILHMAKLDAKPQIGT